MDLFYAGVDLRWIAVDLPMPDGPPIRATLSVERMGIGFNLQLAIRPRRGEGRHVPLECTCGHRMDDVVVAHRLLAEALLLRAGKRV